MDPPSSTQGDRERPKHVKYASIDPVYPKAALTKTHARRRTERDLPCGHAHPKAHIIQALLTPPLTPASSIRTSGSSRDSAAERRLADSADAEKTVEGKEEKTSEQFTVLDPDEETTRVVLLDNLDPTLPITSLESAIIEAVLGGISNSTRPILKSLTMHSTGLGLACACVVFFDVRCSKALAQHLGAGAGTGWFEKVGFQERREGKGKVEARFATSEEALEILGASDSASSFYADEVEGPVYLTVQKCSPLPVNLSDKTSGRDLRQDKKDATNVDINTAMLFSLLKSFGSLRRFDFDAEAGERDNSDVASTLKEKQNQTKETKVYRVEYHDLRDAERAMEELEGRTMFGMDLRFGHRDCQVKTSTTIKAAETAAVDGKKTKELSTQPMVLGPAGVQSNMRKRFRFAGEEDADVDDGDGAATGDAGEVICPQTIRRALLDVGSAGGDDGTGTPSPTFFYTSSTASVSTGAGYLQEQPKAGLGERDTPTLEPQVAGSGHSFSGTSAGAVAEVGFTSGSHAHSSVGSIPNQWDEQGLYPHQQHQIPISESSGTTSTTTTASSATSLTSSQSISTPLSPCYGTSPDGVCLYCPSRGTHPTHAPHMGYSATYPGYGLSPPPPPLPASTQASAAAMAAGMYYPPPTPLPGLSISPVQGSGQAPPLAVSMSMGGYEYLDSQLQMQAGVGGGGVVMSPQQAHAQVGMVGTWTPGYHDPSMAAAGGMVPLPMGMGVPGVGVGMNMMNMGLGMGMPVGGLSMPPPPPPSYMGYVQREDANALVGGGVAVSPDGRTYLYSHYPQHGHGLAGYAHPHSHGPGHLVHQAHGVGIGVGTDSEAGLAATSSGPDSSANAASGLKGRSGGGVNRLSGTTGTAVRVSVGTRSSSSSGKRSRSRLHHHQGHTQQRQQQQQQQDIEFERIRRSSSSPSPLSPAIGIRGSPSLGPSPPPPLQLNDRNQVNDRNQLNIARIEDGLDTRTTVMIKNIPNKMSDRDLMVFIERVCPRRIDFFYLRMDFQNGCNVGYAFVNFIHVQDLLRFAKARLGVKWNMFSSEKVLQMSYANYQGKEALVEKFKNSAIMDERESWRPRIFYSLGQNQGLPESFPPPTHMRRKERSSYNRGALFVPGVGHGVNGLGHGGVGSGTEGALGGGTGVGGLSSRGSLHRRFGHGQFDSAGVHGLGSQLCNPGEVHRWGASVGIGSVGHDGEASRRDEQGSMYRKRFGA